ncbi:MAG: DUF433 domain-containing protein [Deltaproteobacteria bacterium]|nr:DUF433 domain-containing protein [Deltaproteobacteria bacterium]
MSTLHSSPIRPASTPFVGAAEAAFIADLDQKALHRVVDESVLPAELLGSGGESRQFVRFAAAMARFYFDTAEDLSKAKRLEVIRRVLEMLRSHDDADDILQLAGPLSTIDWAIHAGYVTVDVRNAIVHAAARAQRAANALGLIVEHPDILGGRPTFKGTRVPIDVAVGTASSGPAFERMRASYPFLTPAHIDAANVYSVIRPRRGRPLKLEHGPRPWKLKSTRRIPRSGA